MNSFKAPTIFSNQGSQYRTSIGRIGRYIPYWYAYRYRNINVSYGLNTGCISHVSAIPANFGQYQPVPGVLARTEKSFIYLFILF